MLNLQVGHVVYIHDLIIERTGGMTGIRDKGLLHSAIERPNRSAFGIDRYKNIFMKSAAVLDSIANNHPFVDGNKRTAMAAADLFLYLNGYNLSFTNEEYKKFMLHVVNHKPPIKKIANWLKSKSMRMKENS